MLFDLLTLPLINGMCKQCKTCTPALKMWRGEQVISNPVYSGLVLKGTIGPKIRFRPKF